MEPASRNVVSPTGTNRQLEYVARHSPDEVTDALDRVAAELDASLESFVSASSRRVLEASEL